MIENILPLSINLHITKRCNMRCRACFAKYRGKGCGQGEWHRILDAIATETAGRYRVKVSFAGGEPTLVPWLPDLIRHAKDLSFITSIITNGGSLDERYLASIRNYLDWVGISVDSLRPDANISLGRTIRGRPISAAEYLAAVRSVHESGLKLKINTVVSALNQDEEFRDFIALAKPERWKVMQFLRVRGQNWNTKRFEIDPESFERFYSRHASVVCTIKETSKAMLGSYIMIDPAGRPYGNVGHTVRYGRPVLLDGVLPQLPDLGYDLEATRRRGGFGFF